VSFHYKADATGAAQFGLIAEEVNEVCPALVVHDAEGEIYGVRYEAVNAMLLNEFLKDHRRVEDLRTENAALRDKNVAVEKRLAELETRDKEREARLSQLEQFIPAREASPARVTLK
jgi:hypothetical protein